MSAAPITAPTETTPIARAANGAPVTGDAALFQLLLTNTNMAPATQPAAASAATPTPNAPSPLGVLTLQTEPSAPTETPQIATSAEASVIAPPPIDPLATPGDVPATTIPQPAQTQAPQQAPTQTAAQQSAPQPAAPVAVQAQSPQPQNTQTKSAQAKPDAPAVSEETPVDQPKAEAALASDAPVQAAATLPAALVAQVIAPQAAATKPAPAETAFGEAPVEAAGPIKVASGPKKTGAPAPATNANAGAQSPNAVAVNTNGAERSTAAPIADTMAPSTPAIASASASTQATSADTTTAQAARPALQSPAAMSVAQQIVRRFDGHSTSFQMRMDPPELGKVEVRLNVDRNKKVTASVSADNPQTLNELRASSRELERALNEAGLDLAQNGLSFDLKDDAQTQRGDYASAVGGKNSAKEDDDLAAIVSPAARPFGMERWGGGGVDVWA